MSSLDDKIIELERQYQSLESQSPSSPSDKKIILYGFLGIPIAVYSFIYFINPKFFQVDGKRNRKKILKFSLILSLILIVALYYYIS
jgi:hypothetical protein